MPQMKKSVTARIPIELYDECNQQYENMTDAIIKGLELLCNTNRKTDVISDYGLIEEKNRIIEELQNSNETLSKELFKIGSQIQLVQENHQERITDLKEQIISLQEQMKVKDTQLGNRDDEIKQLTENIKGQAITIHNLTQKQLPEPKKKWYQFWLR